MCELYLTQRERERERERDPSYQHCVGECLSPSSHISVFKNSKTKF